jgi:hypothetical protein
MADDRNTKPPVSEPDDEENVVIDTTSAEPLREATLDEGEQPEAVRDSTSRGTKRDESGTLKDERTRT